MSRLYLATLYDTPNRGILLELHEGERASNVLKLQFPKYQAGVVCLCCINQEQVDQIPKLLEGRDWPRVFVKRADLWAHDKKRLQNTSAPVVSSWPTLLAHLTEAGDREDELRRYQDRIDKLMELSRSNPDFDPNTRFNPEHAVQCLKVMEEHSAPPAGTFSYYEPKKTDTVNDLYGFRDDAPDKAAEEERHHRRTSYKAPTLRDTLRKKGQRK